MVSAISNHEPLTSDDQSKVDDDDDDKIVAHEHVVTPPKTKTLDLLKWLSQVFLQTRRSTWILSALPLLGVAIHFFFIKKFNKFLLPKLLK